MKNKVIINGIDVSKCVSYDDCNGHNICCYLDTREDKIPFANFCVENKNCYFKQLKRAEQKLAKKEQEIEKLKVQIKNEKQASQIDIDNLNQACLDLNQENDNLLNKFQAKEQECEELRNKLNSNIERMNEQNEKLHKENKELKSYIYEKEKQIKQQLDQYKQTLDEIAELCKNHSYCDCSCGQDVLDVINKVKDGK